MWFLLVDDRYVWECLEEGGGDEVHDEGGRVAIRTLAERYRRVRRATERGESLGSRREKLDSDQERSDFSACLAELAAQSDEVRRFRSRLPGGGLLSQEEGDRWIASRGEGDSDAYGAWRSLAEDVARKYVWRPVDAGSFLLTGTVPRGREAACFWRRHEIPRLTRIRLSFSPFATPDEISTMARSARADFFEYHYFRRRRAGKATIGERQAALARFAIGHSRLSRAEQWKEWNRRQEEEGELSACYGSADTYGRAVRRSLLHVGLEYPFSDPCSKRDDRLAAFVLPEAREQALTAY